MDYSPQNLLSDSCLHKGIILPREIYLVLHPLVLFKGKRTWTFKGTICHVEISLPLNSVHNRPPLSIQEPTLSSILRFSILSLLENFFYKRKKIHLLIHSILQQHRFESESKDACPLVRLSSFRMGVRVVSGTLGLRVGIMFRALCVIIFLTLITATSFFHNSFDNHWRTKATLFNWSFILPQWIKTHFFSDLMNLNSAVSLFHFYYQLQMLKINIIACYLNKSDCLTFGDSG